MPTVHLTRGDDGRLRGHSDADQRAYAKWRAAIDHLGPGDLVQFEFRLPRSPQHHRLFFAMVAALFERQEQFDDPEKLRQWLTVGAGYSDFVPGPTGRMVALPRSIAWTRMDEAEFAELHRAVIAFLRTPHAYRFLWPQLDDAAGEAAVEDFLAEFEE